MKIVVLQPTVPSYRRGFFERLSTRLGPAFVVYASEQDLGVLTDSASRSGWERRLGPIRSLLPGVDWQQGALTIPFSRGDVVVISGNPRCLSNIVLLAKARWQGARTIWWGQFWSSTSRAWRAAIRNALMRLSDAVLFYTDREVAEYRSAHPTDRRRVSALNNGIDTSPIERHRLPYSADRPRDLLFIGRLTPKAELGLLLQALARPESAGATLDIIGGGEDEYRLRSLCNTLGIADRVAWHGGTVDEERIAAVANECKVFVYPGSVGLSLVHGLAYGLPAIVHDDRWKHMPEISAFRPGENGLSFARGDAASLAMTIRDMLSDRRRLESMSDEALGTTARSYNAADMADRFCAAIGREPC